MALIIESLYFYPVDNARKHHTDRFEIVHSEPNVPVLRRGQEFSVGIRFKDRHIVRGQDKIRIYFNCGKLSELNSCLTT